MSMCSTLTPFLYQTRTILKPSVALRSVSTTAGQLHRRPRGQDIPFEWEGAIQQERADIPSGRDGGGSGPRSTITPSERHVFRKIFNDIAKRGPTPLKPPPGAAATGLPEASKPSNRDTILAKYPESLRRAAEAALGMRAMTGDVFEDQPEKPVSRETLKRGEKVHQDPEVQDKRDEVRLAESIKLRQLLDSCNNDIEVWGVLEQEVFSMVKKLGIAKSEETKKKPVLDMDTYGPVYSLHLLESLKALDRSFVQPSPMALNVLPRVRELGLASYVLGVSTPFYNELASIFWYRHGDTQAVLGVLDEMQNAGLFFDRDTLKLVETMELTLDSFRDRQLGVFSKAVGTIPGYNLDVKTKVGNFVRRIRHSLRKEQSVQTA